VNDITKANFKGRKKAAAKFSTRTVKPEMEHFFPRAVAKSQKNGWEFGVRFFFFIFLFTFDNCFLFLESLHEETLCKLVAERFFLPFLLLLFFSHFVLLVRTKCMPIESEMQGHRQVNFRVQRLGSWWEHCNFSLVRQCAS